MGCCGFNQASMEDSASLLEQGERSESRASGARAKVSVTEQASGSPGRVNSVAVAPPEVFYVIVGRGPAAVINHTTLRESDQGRQRIGDLRVMHIGFENPWPNYLVHGMGQPPYLLSLPGFAVQPNAGQEEIDGGLHSRTFGQAINNQLAHLHQNHDFIEMSGWVAWVQIQGQSDSLPPQDLFTPEDRGDELHAAITQCIQGANALNDWPENAGYRLIVFNPANLELDIVYAAYIDFCTGPGRPNILAEGPALRPAKTPPWLAPEVWDEVLRTRRILNGVDAIVDQVAWGANERICITAGGGVGLNGAEKARNNDCFLDWFGRTSLTGTFENPRNHTFLRHDTEFRALQRGELDVLAPLDGGQRNNFVLLPTSIKLRFGKGAEYADATNEGAHVSVTLQVFRQNLPQIFDFNGDTRGLSEQGSWECAPGYLAAAGAAGENWPSRNYDRLVIPNGQEPNALGQPKKFTVIDNDLAPLDVNGRMTALQSADGRVRLLGAACQVYPGFALAPVTTDSPKDRMWAYRATLPVSAVPDGFILSASNIATANGYFLDHPNRNINTMTRAEILNALPAIENVAPNELADAIVGERNGANGYADYDALMAAVNLLNEGHRVPITAAFRFDYT